MVSNKSVNNSKMNTIYIYIFCIALIYFIAFSAFYLACFFDISALYKLIISNKTYQNLPFKLSDTDLKLISDELMSYISGKLKFLDTKVTINGVISEFYSLRSKIHMADVRNIIVKLININYISIFICIITLFKILNFQNLFISLKKIYLKITVVISSFLAMVAIYASISFDMFFTTFHKVLFTNDLWLLDPNEDYIICLLPEKIFMIYGLRIVVCIIFALVALYFLLHILSKIQSRQEAI